MQHSLDEVKSLLREYRLEQLFERLCELGVECREDLTEVREEDLTDFTPIQRRRFAKMVQERLSVPTEFGSFTSGTNLSSSSTPSFLTCDSQDSADATIFAGKQLSDPTVDAKLPPPSRSSVPLNRPYSEGRLSIRYCTVQPLFAKRQAQLVGDINPAAMTMQQLVKYICRKEGKDPEVTAQLYTFEGVPLSCNTVTAQYTLEEWHVTNDSFFWVIFHSTAVEDDTAPPETLPALDPNQGSTQIFVKGSKTITIMINLSDDDGQTLRQKIYSKTRTPTSVISLSYGGRLISNDQKKLQDYDIDRDSTVHMWVSPQRRYSVWDSVFRVDLCRPVVQQTASGMSTFNSCLRVLADQKEDLNGQIIDYLLHITQCPPLVLALKVLFEKKIPNKAHKVAIHEGLYQVFRAIVPTLPAMVPPNTSPTDISVFDHSIYCWTHLLESLKSAQVASVAFEEVGLTCSISHEHLKDPIKFTGGSDVFERHVVERRLDKGELIPGLSAGREYTMEDFVTDGRVAQMVMACPTEKSVFLLKTPFTIESLPTPTKPAVGSFIELGSGIPKCLKVFSPLALKGRDRTFPCLTVNAQQMTVVCTDIGKGVDKTHYLYDPATGDSDLYNLDELAAQVMGRRQLRRPTFKKEGTITRTPKEAIVVILDRSTSMKSGMFDDLSRLDIVKELFKTFADRSMAYNYHHVIGLTLFNEEVEVVSSVSEEFVLFQDVVQNVQAGGRTAVWDAMVTAAEQLDVISSTYPDCIKRILCLTDGGDNESTNEPHEVAKMLQEKNIVLDCVLAGEGNTTAKAIAVATNGCAFFPSNHKESLRLFQMETVLSIRERLVGQRKPPVTSKADLKIFESLVKYPYSKKPERTLPGELKKDVTSPGRVLQRAANPPKGLAAPSLKRVKRILAEIAEYQRNPHPNIEIYPCEQQLDFWRLLLVGPPGTPYGSGVFLLYAKFPTNYPQVAPEIRFVTPIYHCNVNGHGKICHSVFDRNYSSDFSVRRILDCVFGLLLTPEPEDPLDSALAQEYYDNVHEYERTAEANTREHARKTLQEWRKELVGSDNAVDIDAPPHLLCASSGRLMTDPVMTPYGHTYERSVIEDALRKEQRCPKTGRPLTKDQLFVSFAIQEALKEYKRAQVQTAWYLEN